MSDPAVEFERELGRGAYQAAWRYCCWLCRNREDAEDLLQESLARAYQCFHQLRDRSCFRSWLLSTVRRCFLMLRRSTAGRLCRITTALDEQAGGLVSLSADAASPLSERLVEAIAALPAAQRELLALFYFEGLTLRETARVLGTTPNGVMQRLHRARSALRRSLGSAPRLARTGLPQQGVIR